MVVIVNAFQAAFDLWQINTIIPIIPDLRIHRYHLHLHPDCILHQFLQLERNTESEKAAYAALITLSHTIDQIQHHPRLLISLDEGQLRSLTEKVTFLQKFLEVHSHGCHTNTESAYGLERRIAESARAAEDIVESYVLDQILVRWEKKFHKYLGEN